MIVNKLIVGVIRHSEFVQRMNFEIKRVDTYEGDVEGHCGKKDQLNNCTLEICPTAHKHHLSFSRLCEGKFPFVWTSLILTPRYIDTRFTFP